MSDDHLRSLLQRWFDGGDRKALAEVVAILGGVLRAPGYVVRLLGTARIDEIRQDCLWKLLSSYRRELLHADSPRNYAAGAWRNFLSSASRVEGRRRDKAPELEWRRDLDRPPDWVEAVHRKIDAARIAERVDELSELQRHIVWLTTDPARLDDREWEAIAARHPPPPPARPEEPVDRRRVVELLFPDELASEEDRKRAKDRCDKAHSRAVKNLRELLGGGS